MSFSAGFIVVIGAMFLVLAVTVFRRSRGVTIGPRRNFVMGALAAGVGVGAVLFFVGGMSAGSLGLVQMLAPGVGALVFLTLVAVRPAVSSADPSGEAELRPRGVASLGPGWLYALPAIAAALMVCAILFFGFSSSPDEAGRHRVIRVSVGAFSGSSSPYPGWYYGIPALVMAGLLLAVTVVALRRVVMQPLRGDAAAREQTRGWQAGLARVVMAVSSGSFLLYTGGILFFGGVTTGNSLGGSTWTEELGALEWDVPVISALATAELAAGLGAAVLGMALVVTSFAIAVRR